MKGKEENHIDGILFDLSRKFPTSKYLYELMGDTHFIRVMDLEPKYKSLFLDFSFDVLVKFYEENFDSLLHIADEEILIELGEPNQFSMKGESISVRREQESSDIPDLEFIICAA